MQLDTGAAVSVLPEALHDQQFCQWPLCSTKIKLKAYSGVGIRVYGKVHLLVVYEQQELVLPLIVVDGDGPPLLGRNWLNGTVFFMSAELTLSEVLERHKNVFDNGLGTIKGLKAGIKLQDGAKPVFCKARPVPYALRHNVEEEMDRLESLGVIKKVERSDCVNCVVTSRFQLTMYFLTTPTQCRTLTLYSRL